MTCSFAVRGALKKFAEVQKAEVSLNRGIASMQMKPGNKIKVTDIYGQTLTIRALKILPDVTQATKKQFERH